MPYPQEHACRLKDPKLFQSDSFRRGERNHNGKKYSVIFGRLKGKTKMTEQAYRYNKKTWSASEAGAHCRSHKGKFEAAQEEKKSEAAKDNKYNCECIECGHKITSDEHCADLKCSECGGQMRRVERPGPGKDKKKGKYSNVLTAVYGAVWAIMPEKLQAILDFIDLKVIGTITAEEIESITAKAPTKYKSVKGNIAILPLFGVISQRINMLTAISGGTSVEQFGASFDEAISDKSIGAIVLDVDSPGGGVYGVQEVAEKIYNARGQKPIVTVANSLSASAAYWISSSADEVVMTPSGEVGSIGVLAVHTDVSEADKILGLKRTMVKAGKYKTEGIPYEPLEKEGLAYIQSRVDDYYDIMTSDIARNRNITQSKVKSGFGEGRVVGAKQAKEMGMVDRIATFEQVITRLTTKSKPKRSKFAMRKKLELG